VTGARVSATHSEASLLCALMNMQTHLRTAINGQRLRARSSNPESPCVRCVLARCPKWSFFPFSLHPVSGCPGPSRVVGETRTSSYEPQISGETSDHKRKLMSKQINIRCGFQRKTFINRDLAIDAALNQIFADIID
jgi:hypothetical protein